MRVVYSEGLTSRQICLPALWAPHYAEGVLPEEGPSTGDLVLRKAVPMWPSISHSGDISGVTMLPLWIPLSQLPKTTILSTRM